MLITGTGFTVIEAVIAEPIQLAGLVGVIVKVTVIGELVLLVSEPVISLLPLEAIPEIPEGVVLVQLKVVPETELLVPNTILAIELPEQMVCELLVAVATGVALTVIAALLLDVTEQPLKEATAL